MTGDEECLHCGGKGYKGDVTGDRECQFCVNGEPKLSCTTCEAGYHRFGTTDPEHDHSYTACINQLRGNQERLLEGVRSLLVGIDLTETEEEGGWWETSTGAEFGAKKLREIEALWR